MLLIAVAALVAAGCGGSNNNGSSGGGSSSQSSTPSTSSSTSSSSSKASAGGTVTINMQGFQFSPKSQTVKVGQKIVWTNKDTSDHNVIAQSGASFKSGNFGQGSTFSFTPTKAGTVQYTCTLHPGMDGTLTVTK
jgi:plastocyanin